MTRYAAVSTKHFIIPFTLAGQGFRRPTEAFVRGLKSKRDTPLLRPEDVRLVVISDGRTLTPNT